MKNVIQDFLKKSSCFKVKSENESSSDSEKDAAQEYSSIYEGCETKNNRSSFFEATNEIVSETDPYAYPSPVLCQTDSVELTPCNCFNPLLFRNENSNENLIAYINKAEVELISRQN